MIIAFGRAGNERKKLAWAIATIIGTTAEYQYMPTCTYKIGECYTVTKAGDLEISDQADRKETERLLAELENQGYTVPDTSELESKSLTVQMPTALSFPCSANLPRIRAASTASRTPPTIPSTPCGVS